MAQNAKSFRTPTGRFKVDDFPIRTTYARFDDPTGTSQWRMLETGVDLKTLKNSQALIGHDAGVLISVFRS